MTEFRLLETMRLTARGDVYLLDRHLARLQNSAHYFSFKCDRQRLCDGVASVGQDQTGPLRLRLLLSGNGEYELDVGPLPSRNPQQLKLSPLYVNSANPFLYHKTTNRDVYGADNDVILINERGEITETPITNIAVLREGQWITPASFCGLLAGVMRAESLARGELTEGVIRVDHLVPGEPIRCFNALRGVYDVLFASSE